MQIDSSDRIQVVDKSSALRKGRTGVSGVSRSGSVHALFHEALGLIAANEKEKS